MNGRLRPPAFLSIGVQQGVQHLNVQKCPILSKKLVEYGKISDIENPRRAFIYAAFRGE